MVLGIDLGNYTTETSEGIMFPSRIVAGHKELNKNDIKIEFNGKKYTVGTGRLEIGPNRLNSDFYTILLLTAIAESKPERASIKTDIVVGLPPLQFESELKTELKERLNKLRTKEIIINGRKVLITIDRAEVFSESAIVFGEPEKYRDKKTLVIDIGGGSEDISQFKGLQLVKNTTTKFGMLTLCENMKQVFVPTEKAPDYTVDMMEDLINKDTEIVGGIPRDITYLRDVVADHVQEICNVINQNFDTQSTQIVLIGGGAVKLFEYFKKEYDRNVYVEKDNMFVNARTYAAVGEMLWND